MMTADWAMVIITAIYVVATVFIMFANQRSAKSAKEQLAEMKREHEEASRLQVMPYLRFQVGDHLPVRDKMMPAFIINVNEYDGNEDCVGAITAIEITNIGQGLATNIFCSWDDMEHIQTFPVDYLRSDEKECDNFMFLAKKGTQVGISEEFTLTFHFTDILGNDYIQNIVLKVFARENSLEVKALKSETPVLNNKESRV